MESFGVIAFSMSITMGTFGIIGFVFAVIAWQRILKLEKKLKDFDVLPEDFFSADGPCK